jgi:ribonuclease HII
MVYGIGTDEVGRGCLAGDVYVAAVMVPADMDKIEGVADSKVLSPKKREALHGILTKHPDVRYRVVTRPVADITRLGIVRAVRGAFLEAVEALLNLGEPVAAIMVDGVPIWDEGHFPQARTTFLPKGDALDWRIGAASIIAKVERDRYMVEKAKAYPVYLWEKNKGYGTEAHIAAIRQHGLSPLHRPTFCRSFNPGEASDEPPRRHFADGEHIDLLELLKGL